MEAGQRRRDGPRLHRRPGALSAVRVRRLGDAGDVRRGDRHPVARRAGERALDRDPVVELEVGASTGGVTVTLNAVPSAAQQFT